MTKYTVILLVLAGCGHGTVPSQEPQDAAFAPYVTDFIRAASDHGRDLETETRAVRIEFGDPESGPNIGAVCEYATAFTGRRIVVRRARWEQEDSAEGRAAMLFHELGHCVLNRAHRTELNEDQLPVSLMNSPVVSGIYFRHDRERYLAEFFQ